jgi:hypothetical protein
MGIASHHRRLERLEAERGITKTETLYFRLHEWAEGCPIAFEENEDEKIGRMEANALDRLVAAGKIEVQDRDRVTFIARVLVPPLERADLSGATDLISGLAD